MRSRFAVSGIISERCGLSSLRPIGGWNNGRNKPILGPHPPVVGPDHLYKDAPHTLRTKSVVHD